MKKTQIPSSSVLWTTKEPPETGAPLLSASLCNSVSRSESYSGSWSGSRSKSWSESVCASLSESCSKPSQVLPPHENRSL